MILFVENIQQYKTIIYFFTKPFEILSFSEQQNKTHQQHYPIYSADSRNFRETRKKENSLNFGIL